MNDNEFPHTADCKFGYHCSIILNYCIDRLVYSELQSYLFAYRRSCDSVTKHIPGHVEFPTDFETMQAFAEQKSRFQHFRGLVLVKCQIGSEFSVASRKVRLTGST